MSNIFDENFEVESRKIEFGIFSFDMSEIEEEEIFGTLIEM